MGANFTMVIQLIDFCMRIFAVFLNTGFEEYRDQIRKKYFLISGEKPQATITLKIWFRLRIFLFFLLCLFVCSFVFFVCFLFPLKHMASKIILLYWKNLSVVLLIVKNYRFVDTNWMHYLYLYNILHKLLGHVWFSDNVHKPLHCRSEKKLNIN